MTSQDFDALLSEGMALDVEAYWGAGFLEGRYVPGELSWLWSDVVRPYLARDARILDMGTGDGSALASLVPLPEQVVAYEEWWPTVPKAIETLRPHVVHLVVCLGSDDNTARSRSRPRLPFADAAFDVLVNRHEAFDSDDVRRLLRHGGSFVTQQVGGDETESLRTLLGLSTQSGAKWDVDVAVDQLASAGFTIEQAAEDRVVSQFHDIAALLGYLRSTPWAIPEFDAIDMRKRLEELHDQCSRAGSVDIVEHRFWLAARAD